MSDNLIKNRLAIINKKAVSKAQEKLTNEKAKELHEFLFKNQYEILESDKLLVPNYLMIIAKERFYKAGGESLGVYDVEQYSKLLDVPVHIIEKWVKEKPEVFLWIHQKRSFEQEINGILLSMSRSLFNDFHKASPRDKSQMINSIAKFSSLLSPKGKSDEEEIESLIEDIRDPEQVQEYLRQYGYEKTTNIEWATKPTDEEDLYSLEETLEDE